MVNQSKRKSQLKRLLLALDEKNLNAFNIAKQKMQSVKLKSMQAKKALDYYIKRWRNVIHPGLIYLAGEVTNAKPAAITQTQVAVLLLTAGLDIHDDVIDQSFQKNGKLTVYGKFGEDFAVLIGNAFLIKGFAELRNLEEIIPIEKAREVFTTVEETFFIVGDAHALELELRKKRDLSIDRYWQVVKMKAASFRADAKIGAVVGNALPCEIEALAKYGQLIGELTILREDFIDVFEHEELFHRIKNECPPMPILYAFKDAKAKEMMEKILFKEKLTEEDVDTILRVLFSTDAIKKLVREMENLAKEGSDAIKVLDSPKIKELNLLIRLMLEDICDT